MLIHRGREGGRVTATKSSVEEALGVGPSSFFITAKDIVLGSNEWVDAAAGRVGTFENSNYSVLEDSGKVFVRFTNCRVLFPSTVLTGGKNAVVVMASIRLTTGYATKRTLVHQPRTTTALFTLDSYIGTDNRVYNATYHSNASVSTDTSTVGFAPRVGAWGVYAVGKHGYPADTYASPADHRVKVIRPLGIENRIISAYPLALDTLSGLPFMVGGGRASGGSGAGTIANPFVGDIEWLGVWEVPCTAADLRRVVPAAATRRPKVYGIGILPKKEVDAVVYANRSYTPQVGGVDLPYYSAAIKYAPGTYLKHASTTIDAVIQITSYATVTKSTSDTETLGRIAGAACAASTSSGAQLARLVDGTFTRPARSEYSLSVHARSRVTIACASATPITRDTNTSVAATIDMTLGVAPYTSSYFHLPPPRVFIRPYDSSTGNLLDSGGASDFRFVLKNGVYNVKGFKFLGSFFTGTLGTYSLTASYSSVFIEDVHTVNSIAAFYGVVAGHNVHIGPALMSMNNGTVYTDYPRKINAMLSASVGSRFGGASIDSLNSNVCIGGSLLATNAPAMQARNSRVSVSESILEYAPRFPRPNTKSPMLVSLSKGAAPYNTEITTSSLALRKYATPIVNVPHDYENAEVRNSLARVTHIGGTGPNTLLTASGYSYDYDVDNVVYVADFPQVLSVTPYSLRALAENAEGVLIGADIPTYNTDYVEVSLYVSEPGPKLFEIDFIFVGSGFIKDDAATAGKHVLCKILYYDESGILRIFREPKTRTGMDLSFSATATVVAKPVATTWANYTEAGIPDVAAPGYFCGAKQVYLPYVAVGTVRVRIAATVARSRTYISPHVRVI